MTTHSTPTAGRSALLIVDMQIGLLEGERPVADTPGLLARLSDLLERARAADTPVVFVQDDDVGPAGSRAWQIHPALTPRPDEPRVRKPHADSFYRTDLAAVLGERAITRLVIAGCTTDACVDATARRAVSLGYDVVLVADGHSTTDNSFMPAERSIAYYNVILDGFGAEDGFGAGEHEIVVRSAAEVDLT